MIRRPTVIKIRPVSDLRNKFPEAEQVVREGAQYI